MKRGAQGDYSAAAQEALIAASKQGRQVADQLERAAAEAGVLQQVRQGREAAEGVSAQVSQQFQGKLFMSSKGVKFTIFMGFRFC